MDRMTRRKTHHRALTVVASPPSRLWHLRSQSRVVDPGRARACADLSSRFRQREIKTEEVCQREFNMMGRIVRCGERGDASGWPLLVQLIHQSERMFSRRSESDASAGRLEACQPRSFRGSAVIRKGGDTRSEADLVRAKQNTIGRADVERGYPKEVRSTKAITTSAPRSSIPQGRLRRRRRK